MLGTLHYHYTRFGLRGMLAALRIRLGAGPQLLPIVHADARHPIHLRFGTSDVPTFEQVFLDSEYAFEALATPSTIIDAGANIGLAAVLFATRFPAARIIAIEPEAANVEMLRRNAQPYPNIEVVHAALWNEDTEIELVDPGLGSWAFMTRSSKTEAGTTEASEANGNSSPPIGGASVSRVPALTLPTIMRERGIDRIDILKVDIEGAESEVFQAPKAWLGQVGAIIVELHERMKSGSSASFEAAALGFEQRWTRGENVYVSRPGVIAPPGAVPNPQPVPVPASQGAG